MHVLRSEQGSMPVVLFLVAFVGVISVLVLTVTATQTHRIALAEAGVQSRAALETGLAFAANDIAAADRDACTIPGVRPTDFTTAPNGNGLYLWWADKSRLDAGSIKIVVESQSGDRVGAGSQISSLTYQWENERWQPAARVGLEQFPYPATADSENCQFDGFDDVS